MYSSGIRVWQAGTLAYAPIERRKRELQVIDCDKIGEFTKNLLAVHRVTIVDGMLVLCAGHLIQVRHMLTGINTRAAAIAVSYLK